MVPVIDMTELGPAIIVSIVSIVGCTPGAVVVVRPSVVVTVDTVAEGTAVVVVPSVDVVEVVVDGVE
jgi:hypothetical protein